MVKIKENDTYGYMVDDGKDPRVYDLTTMHVTVSKSKQKLEFVL